MNKYEPLGKYLAKYPKARCSLSVKEIEEIIDAKLPPSSRQYREWWANDDSHIQARDGWLGVGWKVEGVNPSYTKIQFVRI
jgi:hypothetical protein